MFGFSFEDNKPLIKAPVTPDQMESSVDITGYGNFFSPDVSQVNVNQGAETENELVRRYREISYIPEVDKAIEEITAEAIVTDRKKKILRLNLDSTDLPESVKTKVNAEFEQIYKLLSFHNKGYDIFRRWYVDGRLFYNIIIDPKNPKLGIQELRYIDPRKIKKVREIVRSQDASYGNATFVSKIKEYYIYSDKGITSAEASQGAIRLTKESIAASSSGLIDPTSNITVSYLHKALRTASNLRMMEDAMLIYRLARAPERRIFYVDTGILPKGKAEQYVQEIANKYRAKSVYDPKTGEIKNDTRYLAMTEDFWIPRQEGSKGTNIETLPGGQNVGETGEPEYFKQKLYESLNVPVSRFQQESAMFSQGTEITRDELRFAKFIDRLRVRFSTLFEDLLSRQLILKNIMSLEDWEDIKSDIIFDYAEDNQFSESLDTQVLQGRITLAQAVDAFQGKYYSKRWIQKNILRLTDDDIKEMQVTMDKENQEELEKQMAGMPSDQDDTDGNGEPNGAQFMQGSDAKIKEETDSTLTESAVELNKVLADFLKKD